MRILIIDDEPLIRNLLCVMLKHYGKCEEAHNGIKGLSKIKKAAATAENYDLIFLDLSMPEMDGREVLREIRKFEGENNIPPGKRLRIIMISAFADEITLNRHFSDCQGCLSKPITVEQLKEKMTILGFSPEAGTEFPGDGIKGHLSGESYIYEDLIPVISEENGKIKFYVKKRYSGEKEIKLVETEPGQIEFFKNIIAGQIIATTPKELPLLCLGKGAVRNKDNIMAKYSGMAIFENNKLSIIRERRIKGDVKFGNINFHGKLLIIGDVRDGISLNATGGITVRGSLGACRVKSEGDININRIDGKNKAEIICGGGFRSKFVYDATIKCKSNILIEHEAIDSILKSSANIKATTITGGKCTALKIIEVERAGSPKDVSTTLKTGYDFYKAEKKEFLEKHIAEINKRLDYLNNMTGPAPASALSHSKLPERKHQIQRYIKEKRECLATLESYKNEFKSLEPSNSENSYSAIIVQKVLYKGVRLIIHNLEELVFETINGPLKLDENYIKL